MLDVVELDEAGLRALAFWLYLFSPTYRAQVQRQWREARGGRRALMIFEWSFSVLLGLGLPLLAWHLLT
jgi:hypothetical protein